MKRDKSQRVIEVWADWIGLPTPRRIGYLYAAPSRGKEVFSFEYDRDWLRSGLAQTLDPSLLLFTGPQYPTGPRENFGMFLDSAPDRWGRFLMDRREAQAARVTGRARQSLLESDYLLGVYDGNRVGALRFRIEPDGAFQSSDEEFASPPWTSLRELEHASFQIERPGAERETDYGRWIRMLVAPGGSLGGARPKAGVRDENGQLWIAKFPSSNDVIDMGAWEYLAHTIAVRAGVSTAPALLRRFKDGGHHTFLTKRFDRTADGGRLHFASAMTLLNRNDGDDASSGASYLELAELLVQQGADTNNDLEQLWRRIVFSVCISNVDDHLRNHAFLLRPRDGWVLSPAYDMNPVAYGDGLKLNISDADNSLDLDLVREVADFFRVKSKRSEEIISEVVLAVREWRETASGQGISREEQERMEEAFRVADGV